MTRHETAMIKKKEVRYGSLIYETLYDTLIGDALKTLIFKLSHGSQLINNVY
jgi:hypothetical protein